jgi:hypothetical protein
LTNPIKDIVIYGSCVTRDPIGQLNLKERLLYYHCRSNLASLSEVRPYTGNVSLDFLGPFNRRCVEADLKKTFDTGFRDCYVIFDFIDDRLPMALAHEDEAIVTFNPLVNHGNPEIYKEMQVVRHFDRRNRSLVKDNIDRFADRFGTIFQNNKTILHEATFSKFFSGSSPAKAFQIELIEYYDFLFNEMKSRLSFDHVIDLSDLLDSSAATPSDHKWGHKPFHYSDTYNLVFAQRLTDILAPEEP